MRSATSDGQRAEGDFAEAATAGPRGTTRSVELLEIDVAAVVEGTADASYVTDVEGRILGWNDASERLLGVGVEYALGRLCHEVVRAADPSGRRTCHRRCALAGPPHVDPSPRRVPLEIEDVSGQRVRFLVCGLSIPRREARGAVIVHLLHPVGRAGQPRPGTLTNREREVLREVARGQRNRQVATVLSISEATVRSHMRHIHRKLDAHSRLEAVTKARERELL